uniref:Uncharacterized protein n=1 Tax=Meloidogyne hapla TaxID=6305 RepID=A0A1I8C2E3_MELHA
MSLMLPAFFLISWIVVLLLASVLFVVSCSKKKEKDTKFKSSQRGAKNNSKMDSKMGSRKIDSPRTASVYSQSQGGSPKKRKLSNSENLGHKLTPLETSWCSRSGTDDSDIKSRQTGQRAREQDPYEETATLELKERLLRELEATKSVGFWLTSSIFFYFQKKRSVPPTQITPTKSQTLTTSAMGKTAASITMGNTAASTTMGKTVASTTTRSAASLQKSTILEESKPVQANRAAGARSKTISQIGRGKEQSQEGENEVINPEGEKSTNKTEEVAETSVFGRVKKKFQQMKKPQPKKAKSLMSKNEKGGE